MGALRRKVDISIRTSFLISVIVGYLGSVNCKGPATCLDCYNLKFLHTKSIVDCSETSLPFCDPTTLSCSATPPPTCVNPDNFTCLSDGYFPDPSDCRAFHLCMDLQPTKYFCDSTTYSYYYYDVILHRCTSSARCGYKCSGKTGVKVAHPDDGNLFAYCFNGTVIFQDRCPGNYELNEISERCEAVCHRNGRLVDVESCTMFYKCFYQNGGYYRSHERCPHGQGFNPLSFECEEGLTYCNESEKHPYQFHGSPLLAHLGGNIF